jgi:hypothetical protein
MTRLKHIATLAFFLRCSDETESCDESPSREECSTPELATRTMFDPWPTLEEKLQQLRCACNSPRFGSCADGKQFAADGVGFGGETLYYREGEIVGQWSWGDVASCFEGRVCWGHGSGDINCDETSSEIVPCSSCDSEQP